jgi:quercetin dioxygenase-like cupin family protein
LPKNNREYSAPVTVVPGVSDQEPDDDGQTKPGAWRYDRMADGVERMTGRSVMGDGVAPRGRLRKSSINKQNSKSSHMRTHLNQSLISFTVVVLACTFPSVNAVADDAPVTIVEIFKRAHPELADKEVIVERIELKPGVSDVPHVHAGMITGYVESGAFEFQLKGEPLKTLKAGDIFFEPPGSLHLVARNPDASSKTVIIAFVVNPKGAPLSTPLK